MAESSKNIYAIITIRWVASERGSSQYTFMSWASHTQHTKSKHIWSQSEITSSIFLKFLKVPPHENTYNVKRFRFNHAQKQTAKLILITKMPNISLHFSHFLLTYKNKTLPTFKTTQLKTNIGVWQIDESNYIILYTLMVRIKNKVFNITMTFWK